MLNDIFKIFYPNICLACDNLLSKQENLICIACQLSLPYTKYADLKDNPITKLFYGRVEIYYGISVFNYTKKGKIQDLVFALKYQRNKDVGILLGIEIARYVQSIDGFETPDFLVPVPLHPKRQAKRGYNQAFVICNGIQEVLPIPIFNQLLVRKSFTQTQTKKSKYNRWENVAEVFEAKGQEELRGKHILIVDDVITTGATIEACIQCLQAIEGIKISVACVAHGA